MAKINIIPSDSTVVIDGYGVASIDCSSLASNIWAIEFDSSANTGHIEYDDGTANETITSLTSAMNTLVAVNTDAKATEDAAIATAASDLATLKNTYGWKRQNDNTTRYGEIGDQLDQLYVDMLAGKLDATGTWAIAIKAVKDAHPK